MKIKDSYVTHTSGKEQVMVKVYCYSGCSTCRKALKWLRENGIQYEAVDIRQSPPALEELRKLHARSNLPLRRFFNTSGASYRELGLSQRLPEMSSEEQYALLAGDGMLIRRPLLSAGETVLVGFSETEWAERLKQA